MHSLLVGLEHLDLAVVRVGDVELAVVAGDAEGVLEADLVADAVLVAECEQTLRRRAYRPRPCRRGGANGRR